MANAPGAGRGAPAQGPYRPFSGADRRPPGPRPIELTRTPPTAYRQSLSMTDSRPWPALAAAKRGDVTTARSAIAALSGPIAKKLATWALADSSAESMSFFELDQARRDLAGWPTAAAVSSAPKSCETSGRTPQQVIAWFGSSDPEPPRAP